MVHPSFLGSCRSGENLDVVFEEVPEEERFIPNYSRPLSSIQSAGASPSNDNRLTRELFKLGNVFEESEKESALLEIDAVNDLFRNYKGQLECEWEGNDLYILVNSGKPPDFIELPTLKKRYDIFSVPSSSSLLFRFKLPPDLDTSVLPLTPSVVEVSFPPSEKEGSAGEEVGFFQTIWDGIACFFKTIFCCLCFSSDKDEQPSPIESEPEASEPPLPDMTESQAVLVEEGLEAFLKGVSTTSDSFGVFREFAEKGLGALAKDRISIAQDEKTTRFKSGESCVCLFKDGEDFLSEFLSFVKAIVFSVKRYEGEHVARTETGERVKVVVPKLDRAGYVAEVEKQLRLFTKGAIAFAFRFDAEDKSIRMAFVERQPESHIMELFCAGLRLIGGKSLDDKNFSRFKKILNEETERHSGVCFFTLSTVKKGLEDDWSLL